MNGKLMKTVAIGIATWVGLSFLAAGVTNRKNRKEVEELDKEDIVKEEKA